MAAAVALSIVLLGTSPAAAANSPESPNQAENHGDDIHLATFDSFIDGYQLAGTSSKLDAPYAHDPYIAWREITSEMGGSQVWEIWRCGPPGAANTFTTTAAADSFKGFVGDYFQTVSGGAYLPTFIPKGTYQIQPTSSDLYSWACLNSSNTPGGTGGLTSDRGLLAFHEEYNNGVAGPGFLETTNHTELRRVPGTQGAAFGIGGSETLPHALLSFGDLLVHEIGHTLGWPHIPIRGDGNPYGNPTDLMSGGGLVMVDDEVQLGSTAAISLYASGWIAPNEVREWQSGNSKVRVGTPTSQRTKIIIVPTEKRGRFYTISPSPVTGASLASAGIAVHYIDQTTTGGGGAACFGTTITCLLISAQIELVPPKAWNPGSPTVLLHSGDSLTVGQWTVTVNESHSDGYTVTLTGKAPGTPPPIKEPGNEDSNETSRFIDVPAGHTFVSPITRLAAAGITKGCNPAQGNTRYCPDDYVTRGQMAAFLVRALQLPAYTGPDRFTDDNGNTFETAIERLAQAGITQGCNPAQGNTRYCPDDYVTRGQMAALLVRAGLAN